MTIFVSPGIRPLFQWRGTRGPAPLLIIDTQPIVLLNGWVGSLVLEEEIFDVSATVGGPPTLVSLSLSLLWRHTNNEHNPAAQGKIAMPACWIAFCLGR